MKPHPITENQACSECGLDWSLHPDKPRRRDCIELLKAELASRSLRSYTTPGDSVAYFPSVWASQTVTSDPMDPIIVCVDGETP